MIIVWLRNVGSEEDQCWIVCAKDDPGAVLFEGFPPRSEEQFENEVNAAYARGEHIPGITR